MLKIFTNFAAQNKHKRPRKQPDMKQKFIEPRMRVVCVTPRQIISTSGEGFQAEISGYGTNTGGGFSQDPPAQP